MTVLTDAELKALFGRDQEPGETEFADLIDSKGAPTTVLGTKITVSLTEAAVLPAEWTKVIDLAALGIPESATEIYVEWSMEDLDEVYSFTDVALNQSSAREGDRVYANVLNQSSGHEYNYTGWLPISPQQLEIRLRYATNTNLSGSLFIYRYR